MPAKNANLQKIEKVCQRFADQLGYELCEAVIEKEPTGRYLRIYIDIDNETGVTLDDCERYHRAVQPALEEFDYDFLEVSSPGIDRPLKTARDVEKSIGLMVEVRLYKPLDGRKSAQGFLRAMDDSQVVIADAEENETVFPRSAVAQVRLVPDLSALEQDDEV